MGSEIAVAVPQLRDLDDTRLEAAVHLWDEAGGHGQPAPFSLAEVLAALTAGSPALVAVSGETVIGAIAAAVDADRAWIVRWAVAAEWRRRGIGAALLAGIERRLASAGVREVSLLAARDTEAVDAAEASGYTPHGDLLYL